MCYCMYFCVRPTTSFGLIHILYILSLSFEICASTTRAEDEKRGVEIEKTEHKR